MKFGFVGPSYSSQSLNAECQECINWYPEMIESRMGKNVAALYPTPGLKLFTTLGGSSIRGLFSIWNTPFAEPEPRLFAISGSTLYRIFPDGSNAVWDTTVFADDGLPVSVAYDSETPQGLIISGGTAYASSGGSPNYIPVTGMLGTPAQCAFCDGYFIVMLKDSMKFQISALFDALTWNALDVAIVSVSQDNLLSMIVDHRELWLFGYKVSQVYFNSGNPDFPFDPIPGAYIEQGIFAPKSVVRLDNSIFWLGGDERGAGVAWRAQGYTPTRVSNHAVEYAWQQYSTMADAIGYSYQDQGHMFWVLSFPTANATWVLDVSTGMWHRRGFWDAANVRYVRHPGQNHAYAFGKHFVGDWQSGKVYEMSIDYYDDDGAVIRRLRRCPHISNEQKWVFHHQLQVDMEVGLGLANPALQGYDPQVVLRWSNDGAKTWGNDHFAAEGKLGEYKRRVIWRRLGRSRDRVYELSVTDPIPWRIADAYLDISPGTGA